MPATMTTVSGILKEVYEPRLREQLDNGAVAYKRIEKTAEGVSSNVGGKYTTFPIHTRRNSGIGARREMEALPQPGQQGAAAATVKLKYLYGRAQLSGPTLELVNTNIQAFTSALDFEMDGLKNDLIRDCNRQVWGTGNGAIGTVRSVVTSTVIPVDRADLFNVGDIVDLVTLPNTVVVSGREITAVNLTAGANTVTISGAAVGPTVVGQIITRTGNSPFSATENREWTGLSAIVSDSGTLYGINPATESVWKAQRDHNSGVNRALSEGLMITMADNIKTNGGKVSVIFADLGVRRAYFNLLSAQRQFVNTKEFTGGFTGLAFVTDAGEIPMVADPSAPRNRMFFLNEDELTLYRAHDWEFMDRDGSKWQRVIGYDAYECTLYQYSEFGTHRRNTHGVIEDITEA